MCDPQQGVCGTAGIFLEQPLERGNCRVVLPTIEQAERLGVCWALGHQGILLHFGEVDPQRHVHQMGEARFHLAGCPEGKARGAAVAGAEAYRVTGQGESERGGVELAIALRFDGVGVESSAGRGWLPRNADCRRRRRPATRPWPLPGAGGSTSRASGSGTPGTAAPPSRSPHSVAATCAAPCRYASAGVRCAPSRTHNRRLAPHTKP